MSTDYTSLPDDLPAPVDDGAAVHLPGSEVPAVTLPSTLGGERDLAQAARGRLVVYVYPRTGVPGEPLLDGWDDIPSARGCTPQSCAFRDTQADFARHGATLVGISAQTPREQAEFAGASTSPIPCSATTTSRWPTPWACPPSRPAACGSTSA
jgi:peroxiredoxin